MRHCHHWRETWVSECHPSLVLSCQAWYCQCVNQRSLRLHLGATATGRDDTGGNASPCWECRKFGGLLSIHQTQKMNDKKLRAYVYAHRQVCFCVRQRRTRSESEREEDSGHVLTFDWQSTWENHETFRRMPCKKKGFGFQEWRWIKLWSIIQSCDTFYRYPRLSQLFTWIKNNCQLCLVAAWLLAASSILQ